MRLLYIGDIMGGLGVDVVAEVLPELRKEQKIDLVIAQAENVTDGKGISLDDYAKLKQLGVDCFAGGNWTLERDEIIPALQDPDEPIIRPANYPHSIPGLDYKIVKVDDKKVLAVSLLGQIVGKDSDKPLDNPLHKIDKIIQDNKHDYDYLVVNFHGDYSSEKIVIGHYLDGRATLVVGDHWHVPTADAQILPRGTAHITDVGMTGSLDSSLGVKYKTIVDRWRDGKKIRNELEHNGRRQFNAVLVQTSQNGVTAETIEQIRLISD